MPLNDLKFGKSSLYIAVMVTWFIKSQVENIRQAFRKKSGNAFFLAAQMSRKKNCLVHCDVPDLCPSTKKCLKQKEAPEFV